MDLPALTATVLVCLTGGFVLGRLGARRQQEARRPARRPAAAMPQGEPPAPPPQEPTAAEPSAGDARAELYTLAAQLEPVYPNMAHPRDLRHIPLFERAVALMDEMELTARELCGYAVGDNSVLSCVAFEALRRRRDDEPFLDALLAGINTVSNWSRWLFCELLDERHPQPVVDRVLLTIDLSWQQPMGTQVLHDFLAGRLARGERVAVDERFAKEMPEKLEFLAGIAERIGSTQARSLAAALRSRRKASLELGVLGTIGRVLHADQGPPIVEHADLERAVGEAERAVAGRSRAVLVAGHAGTGKSTLLRSLAQRLRARGFTVFEAGASDLLADQTYMGQLEGRLQQLTGAMAGAPVVWLVPDFVELAWAGRHRFGNVSVLDFLRPHLEADRLRMVGEIEPDGLDRLLRAQPRLRGALEVVRLEPLADGAALDLARRVFPALGEPLLREAFDLAKQYLGDAAPPGNLLALLRLAADGKPPGAPLQADDLLRALTQLTGLPAAILDERAHLDLEALRRLFGQRVLGQAEAVDCLVERVAMLKAGLTDPGRPAGVFLFTGPTGTGKTEIARTLAEFLFGSPDRLLRIDMSELTGPMAQARLLGSGDELSRDQALVHRVREQPFAVVLLDEVEKADPLVWDLFLQVFDAGRLTDVQGRTADFRHAIFILTSNVGSDLLVGQSLGFAHNTASDDAVLGELARLFRPEFLNRIDRIVVFEPLSRTVMRDVLLKELNRVLTLRGLRTRQWAIEWDESALDFLLEKGFSPAQGARPLRRAIERWFLTPLARVIVDRHAPSGDQFLFVRSDGARIDVVFVDPDAPEPLPTPPEAAAPPALDLGSVALEGSGSRDEVAFLAGVFDRLRDEVRGDRWRTDKDAALARLAEPDFWQWEGRFGVLSSIEFRERVEGGLGGAERLLGRLRGEYRHASTDVVRQLAHQLYLLEAAVRTQTGGLPRDAFLAVEARRDARDGAVPEAFAQRISGMYRAWAAKRRMHVDELETARGGDAWRWTAAVTGYGAWAILAPEAGLHVLEQDDSGDTQRLRVRVRVAAQPDRPLRDLLAAARAALAEDEGAEPRIVRRYRELPSPLVRDAVRGWRTGRFDRVLGGDFDLVR